MHVLFRDTRTLDDDATAVDLGQSAGDIVFLSFSDSDLAAVAAAGQNGETGGPSLRLASLARLKHPLSIDLYIEQVIGRARCVVIRLLGGVDYWRYGVEQAAQACRARGAELALLSGDGRDDPRLAEFSTVDAATLARLNGFFAQGGPANMANALVLARSLAGLGPDNGAAPRELATHGAHLLAVAGATGRPLAVIVFYRAYLLAADLAPIDALAAALAQRGLDVRALYVDSLKAPETALFVAARLRAWKPAVVLNATGFSARLEARDSPLDAAEAPVLQLVLSGSTQAQWADSSRGLNQTDLAMQVVLPELDGRLLTAAISFKEEQAIAPALEFARLVHRPDLAGVALAADRAAGWARLARAPRAARKLALVLSNYPGVAGQAAHAVGLDALASAVGIVGLLKEQGYACGAGEVDLAPLLGDATSPARMLLADYELFFDGLPPETKTAITAAWGAPAADPAIVDDSFPLKIVQCGAITIAIQPDRGAAADRKAGYHNPDLAPRHAYVAFYLWLRHLQKIDAMIHLGAHGTLEWLPGKALALSESCCPAVLLRGLPVIYPFIANNPGEAAAAKRRLGAVTIGHLTPPLKSAGSHGAGAELERLLDEYAAADGLDRRRTLLLRKEILERASGAGLLGESGVTGEMSEDDQLARLDAYLCDVKDMQIRDGLHIFGCAPPPERRAMLLESLTSASPETPPDVLAQRLDASAELERRSLLAALDGKFVPAGPAGAPTRGRADVLPTGRNLFTIDPRAVPTRSAVVLAEKAAADLIRRHMQDHGDWPRRLVLDLWGSATMRTGGEDLALALALIGARPVWDTGSSRVTGIDILPLAVIDRPRVDVTLRVSGLFRDAFEAQIMLFDSAVRAVAQRDEPAAMNALAAASRGLSEEDFRRATTRVYGAAAGAYGAGLTQMLERGGWENRRELGDAYLAASGHAYGLGLDGAADRDGFAARVRAADSFVHQQDHRETDLSTAPITQRTRAASPPPPRRWEAHPRSITPTRRAPISRRRVRWRRRSPVSCVDGRPIPAGSRA